MVQILGARQKVLVDHPPVTTASLLTDSLPVQIKTSTLLPLNGNQILLAVSGGTTVIDGVTLTERTPGEESIKLNQQYLFILDISPDRLARLPLEAAGVFTIGGDGNTLSPITSRAHPVVKDVNSPQFRFLSQVQRSIALMRQHDQ